MAHLYTITLLLGVASSTGMLIVSKAKLQDLTKALLYFFDDTKSVLIVCTIVQGAGNP